MMFHFDTHDREADEGTGFHAALETLVARRDVFLRNTAANDGVHEVVDLVGVAFDSHRAHHAGHLSELTRTTGLLLGLFLKLRFLLFPVVLGLLAIAYFCFNNMSSEMAPTEDSNAVMVNLNMPEGVTLTRTKRMADAFAEEVIALMDTNEYSEIQAGGGFGNDEALPGIA